MAAVGDYLDGSARDVFHCLRLAGPELVDEVHIDAFIRITEVEILTPGVGHRQACCGHVRFA